ncbi:MAG: NfeD family protein [Gammaproteobacteria bacterium]|nr:NfeD family protein [Gammaproteobacteria bacterium]
MIGSWLSHIDYWHWWVLAFGLLVLEIFAPGAVFVWMGVGAIASGFLLLVFPSLSLEAQILTFAVVSIGSLVGWKLYRNNHPIDTGHPFLNQRGERFVGHVFVLEKPIINGRGSVRAEDTTWRVHGPNLPAGASVRVTSVDGALLVVEAAQDSENPNNAATADVAA